MFLFSFFFSVLAHQYSFSYIYVTSHILSHIFSSVSQQFSPTTYLANQPNFLWSSSTSRHQLPPSTSPTVVPLFIVSSASDTMERLASPPPLKMAAPHLLSFSVSISHNQYH
jgi:hypothetical protein